MNFFFTKAEVLGLQRTDAKKFFLLVRYLLNRNYNLRVLRRRNRENVKALEMAPALDDHFMACFDFSSNCSEFVDEYILKEKNQKTYGAPMLWIGNYVAAVSLVCSLAMAADAYQGFRQRKLWFPSKFFGLNAASLTLLAIAMKLPVDLTSSMEGSTDQLAKLSSTAFMCTIIGNLMPSIGPMDNRDILLNVIVVSILVITILVNVCIQLKTHVISTDAFNVAKEHVIAMFFMLLLLVILSFSALAVSISKRILEVKYRDMHKTVSTEEPKESNKSSVEILKDVVRKYWLMAETGSPQFVMACSATSSTSGVICLMVAVVLVEAEVRILFNFQGERTSILDYPRLYHQTTPRSNSDYRWSTVFILWIQSFGVIVGTIAPAFRWFTAVRFTCSRKESNNYRNELKVEGYWIQPLAEWKEIPLLPLRIRNRKCRKLIQNAKNSILNFCTRVQVLIVVASKTEEKVTRNSHKGSDTEPGVELDLNRYVLRLEGEVDLPERILKNISIAVDRSIQKAKRQQPEKLMELLEKSSGFKGIVEFDSNQVPSLHSEEPPNTWSLPVVTLTSIAISLPNIKSHIADSLLCSVNEGLSYASLIDQTLENIEDWINLKDAANFVWVRVELYRKWLDEDLQRIALKGKTCRENLQRLADIAKDYVMEFLSNVNRGPEHEPLNWPVKVIAANSMYRISQTLLLQHQDNQQSNEELLEQLSVMIADILCACLTNLPGVITRKCFCNAIEKREESVRLAARLLGETEAILNTLQQRELPPLDPNQVAYIDEWRTSIKLTNPSASTRTGRFWKRTRQATILLLSSQRLLLAVPESSNRDSTDDMFDHIFGDLGPSCNNPWSNLSDFGTSSSFLSYSPLYNRHSPLVDSDRCAFNYYYDQQ
ncbi:hypothetical protein RJ640_029972 [Escallonia rubra]|uniref:Uncharacterized protein n=1 Tax=Escallonia rubra TaxID=112253 RepID=A0AA88UD82_9ASTE|nr:hypothetical protein RJ640_029972 [Escallonia rubra]